jgi:DNA-binding HxlR family transcriptional regulator
MDASPEELLGALSDPERLAIAGALARGPATAGELTSSLNLRPDRVRRHLSKLAKVGLIRVDGDRRTYRYQPEALRQAARSIGPARDAGLALGAVYEEEEQVLRRYFRSGRLREIPAKHSKRLIILSRLALEFDVGVRYTEQQINQTLKQFHNDYAALRRHLVDEGFLSRERGQYWRSGGSVAV